MKLIVGLGNPGKEYKNTRHNLGFWVVDQLAQELKIELNKKKFNGLYCQTSQYILLKPQTGMNNSGECIRAFLNYFHIPADNLLVIYDDIALPVGKFHYRTQGSSGGHNGVKSIIELLNSEEFKRLRVGIDYERNFLIKEWVLGNFSSIEKQEIKKIMPNLIDSLLAWIKENNFVKIMNKFNK
ncbi:MAG: aminoacyl-tRNA hydrolase [Candidatus Moeniiplasma glomeromycotorum]|nr:aminoacyl-tRNA hydrolase [Candidatus Moeniiplasma glomeromycotorum]MCE8169872.1 aminoacyl-tRNA hydrolase [Candidatus Moeniiplasma glomeromycotorum]